MRESDVKPGYVYHINDLYFDNVKDDKLMRNHEGGAYRPTYFCIKDNKTGLLWVIPMSSRVDKYAGFVQKDIDRYGECLKIVLGKYANIKEAFLLQNMFPILPKYINHIHLVRNNPVPVSTDLKAVIDRNFREVLRLHRRGIKIVFPDILRLEKLMLEELAADKKEIGRNSEKPDRLSDGKAGLAEVKTAANIEPTKETMADRMAAASIEAGRRNGQSGATEKKAEPQHRE